MIRVITEVNAPRSTSAESVATRQLAAPDAKRKERREKKEIESEKEREREVE